MVKIQYFLSAVAIGLFPSTGSAQTDLAKTHMGECIFSTDVMPKNDFSHPAYSKITRQFTDSDPIAARCFYGEGVQEKYAKLGRIANSMRDEGKYFAEYEWIKPDEAGGSHDDFRIVAYNHNFRADWNQQRYDLTSDHAECDFKIKGDKKRQFGAKSDGCMDFSRFTKLQSQRLGVSAPTNPEFCVRVFVKFANREIYEETNGAIVREPDYVEKTMARGCFKVRIDASGQSSKTIDVGVSHKTALANLTKACETGPLGGPQYCNCVKTAAVDGGLGSYSPNAANLFAVTMINPSAFTAAERESAFGNATNNDRTEAASRDLAELNAQFQMSCQSYARR